MTARAKRKLRPWAKQLDEPGDNLGQPADDHTCGYPRNPRPCLIVSADLPPEVGESATERFEGLVLDIVVGPRRKLCRRHVTTHARAWGSRQILLGRKLVEQSALIGQLENGAAALGHADGHATQGITNAKRAVTSLLRSRYESREETRLLGKQVTELAHGMASVPEVPWENTIAGKCSSIELPGHLANCSDAANRVQAQADEAFKLLEGVGT